MIVNTRSGEYLLRGLVMWGAWSVASYFKTLVPDGEVRMLDENNESNFLEKFKTIAAKCDLVGFSVSSMQIAYTLPLIKHLKSNFPHIRVIIGGIHPVLFPGQNYGGLIDEVVTYDLPKDYFFYEFLPASVKEVYKIRSQVITGFNCSFKCAFCVNSVRNCTYEGVPLDKIKADLDYVIKEFKPKKIYFRDEDFFQDINKARAIIDYILEKKYKFGWDTSSRVSHFAAGKIDDELLDKMKQAGCLQLRFGVESGSQRVLNYLRKGQTVSMIKNAVKQCVAHGIGASCSLLIGIPTETAAEREETYKLIEELSSYGRGVNLLGPQLYRPYPGGALYEEIKKYGLKFPESFEEWANYYDKGDNPQGHVFDTKINYPWLDKNDKKTLPYAFACVHYGLNYKNENSKIKKIISWWFMRKWKKRDFGSPIMILFMYVRKKYMKLLSNDE